MGLPDAVQCRCRPGLVAALVLVAAPFIPAEESAVTGAVLSGFALGWALLAVLSVRFTDQPQRWAAAPALFMGLGGLLLVGFGSSVGEVLTWVWPPAMLALAIWMAVRAHRQLRSPSKRWVLYPVIAVLALASVGGGYETLRQATDTTDDPMPGQLNARTIDTSLRRRSECAQSPPQRQIVHGRARPGSFRDPSGDNEGARRRGTSKL